MPDPSNARRLFTENEISSVLKRATELQTEHRTDTPTGLSMDELKQIAADVGIDPKYLDEAVGELDQRDQHREAFNLWGAPYVITLERVVQGEVDEAAWENIVAEAREAFKGVGQVGQLGASMEWTYQRQMEGNEAHVSVTPREGQTHIRITSRFPNWTAVSFAPLMSIAVFIAIILPVGLSLAPWLEILLSLGVFNLGLFLARLIFRSVYGYHRETLKDLLQTCQDFIETTPSRTIEQASAPPVQPPSRIDPALLDEPEPDALQKNRGDVAAQRKEKPKRNAS